MLTSQHVSMNETLKSFKEKTKLLLPLTDCHREMREEEVEEAKKIDTSSSRPVGKSWHW